MMIGTEKQIKWAKDIKRTAVKLLYDNKGKLGAGVYLAVNNIENINDAGYLIGHLKDITYKIHDEDKLEILINWMRYTDHEDFLILLGNVEIDYTKKQQVVVNWVRKEEPVKELHWSKAPPEIIGDFF